MASYVVTRAGSEAIEQVVQYSAPPPARVVEAWGAQGYRLVRVRGPQASARARAIIQAPDAWRVRGDALEPR